MWRHFLGSGEQCLTSAQQHEKVDLDYLTVHMTDLRVCEFMVMCDKYFIAGLLRHGYGDMLVSFSHSLRCWEPIQIRVIDLEHGICENESEA
jgi:hypothetical protein